MPTIIGAIVGDIIGSVYEASPIKKTQFDLFNPYATFTDDTVLTIAIADCILHKKDFAHTLWEYGNRYPHRGYGGAFYSWLQSCNLKPYNSFGNGSAMRVSPVGFAYTSLHDVCSIAEKTAAVTHNHPQGIKGAQAVAASVFLAKQGKSKEEIKHYIAHTFGYNLEYTIDEIRPSYHFDVTCQGSVPQAIVAFLDSTDYESAVRLAISLGGDADTQACIAGAIATAFYKSIPAALIEYAYSKLPGEFIDIIKEFDTRYG
ncbi:MAG: ADP-ribosylglycohydrolase family protein [Spirochaetes bacterium]|nr:ADP-ribosylglycohydrolase family protein [Spirochaetota bacterium]